MRSMALILLVAAGSMAYNGWDASWEDLQMPSTIGYCIIWDENGGRMLAGTYEGFQYWDLIEEDWTVVEESGMMGRQVLSIEAGGTDPNIIITGRENAFFKGYIDVSFDLGQTWDYFYASFGGGFWAMHRDLHTADRYYAGSVNDIEPGELVATSDNGQTWTSLNSPHYDILDITQTADGAIFTCGTPNVYRSENGGATWEEAAGGLSSSTVFYAIAAHETDPDILICSDENGIYKTSDHGDTWTHISSDHCFAMEYCPGDPDRVAAVTYGGSVIGSTDGGESWFDITGDLPGYAADLAFCADDGYLYVITMYDGTYRTSASFTSIEGDGGASVPAGLSLTVTPNPVFGSAAVSWSLPIGGAARLDVFDISGRLVSTLASGEMPAGDHQASLHVSDTTPGVLFVRLTSPEGSLVKKVLVTR